MEWLWMGFSELSNEQLYQVLQLRQRVFAVEQKCAYLDCDGNDQAAWHLLGYQDGQLVAYLRAFKPENFRFAEASLGRVITSPSVRGSGLGKELMKTGIEKIHATFSKQPIRISAQAYLQKFYEDFGFQCVGDVYLEDEIPHIEMLLSCDL